MQVVMKIAFFGQWGKAVKLHANSSIKLGVADGGDAWCPLAFP
jgi:hypothetical protein